MRRSVARSEKGSSIVEYVLLVGLIAIVCMLTLNVLGFTAHDKYSAVASLVRAS